MSVGEGIKCGMILLEIKGIVGHGKFMKWVKDNTQISHKCANRYMKLAENMDSVTILNATSLTECYVALGLIKKPVDDEEDAVYHRQNVGKDAPFVNVKTLNYRERIIRQAALGKWVQDGLRHGFGTYYKALTTNIEKVADQMGNSITIAKKHYARAIPAVVKVNVLQTIVDVIQDGMLVGLGHHFTFGDVYLIFPTLQWIGFEFLKILHV